MTTPIEESPLPSLNRYITTHNHEGKATISEEIPSKAVWTDAKAANFFLGYCTKTFPVDLTSDVSAYNSFLASPPGLTVSGGTVLRIVDMRPGVTSPMHRTVSLDYGVVLEGEVELILDSGEKRILKRGDTTVQRATNHAWRNTSQVEWARMLYVLVQAQPLEVEGRRLEEELGGMEGVKSSD